MDGARPASRLTLHRWVDGAAFLLLLGLAATGLLLRWSHGPGRGWLKQLHYWLAEGFLVSMVLHLALHWSWIAANLLASKRSKR
jgi:hypothetical protein